MRIDCTVCIMTFNEEYNIKRCLDTVVNDFARVCIVDSFSNDKTISIVKKYKNVDIFENEFVDWARQRNWIANRAKLATPFILFLDADETIPEKLKLELDNYIKNNSGDFGDFSFKHYFLGQPMNFSIRHPRVVRLFRVREGDYFTGMGAREYPIVSGKIHSFRASIRHEDLKPLELWFEKHINNALKEATYLGDYAVKKGTLVSLQRKLWMRLPAILRPFLYFCFRYFFLGGIFDGRAGFIFCFFQALAYQMQISAMLIEKKIKNNRR